ncbi:hydrolase [Pedobacter kyonggii]|uniref:Hydrolase n=1 Tax=Pedobacter kyonggii TaxID=1926871 RepID=A0A4Q9HGQ7_9SPHI|nr:hydrolase [Pedobacter kyonggii]TBO44446.1 hydrolase [Pedobacter kyonggii]
MKTILNKIKSGLALRTALILLLVAGSSSLKAQNNPKAGLGALLTPDNCALLLIDHQPFQFTALLSHPPQTIINNTLSLAKTAKVFNVPTLLTTVIEERGGFIFQQLQDVFPEQKPINRTFINAWEDKKVTDWVKKTGKKKIVIAGLWTEICVAMPALQALGEGYEVYVVADASGGNSPESHEMAMLRMIQAGVVPITAGVFQAELQRDWARTETANKLGPILIEHGGSTGTSFAWELQLLAAPKAKN